VSSVSTSPRAMGRVILVGAGPGDPELLTLRGARALEEADLVLYDALVDPRTLQLASRAQRFFVGKRAGRASIAQTTICALLVRAARRGRVVVRLKAGDPFVFGRGGEEVLACDAARVPVEVIAGVSSAVAGPQAMGIPVTHRGMSSGFVVLTAVPSDGWEKVLLHLPPGAITVVMLMAIGARAKIASFLDAAGWPNTLPSAIVMGASTPRAWSWIGTLGELAGAEIPADRADLPGLVVLGPVVSLADAVRRATGVELRISSST